jgi:hypothetical protein
MSIEIMKQALKALDLALSDEPYFVKAGIAMVSLRQAIEQAEGQEPIGWITEDYKTDQSATTYDKTVADRWKRKGWPVNPIYAKPLERKWIGLTDDEINFYWAAAMDRESERHFPTGHHAFAYFLENRLKDENNGQV